MQTKSRSLQQIVEDQAQRWQLSKKEAPEKPVAPVITLSREPGSGGRVIAEMLAARLGLDIFHQEIIHKLAESAHVHPRILETLDEKGMNVLQEWISSLVNEHHLWPDEYLKHLMKLIGIIGRHGGAVLVGRGANFILPPDHRLRVRVIAPMPLRVDNVSRQHKVSKDEARRHIIRTESERRAFIRKYFNADIDDPLHYDLTINTGILPMETAVKVICGALEK